VTVGHDAFRHAPFPRFPGELVPKVLGKGGRRP
jgi:hypothetical protein